MAGVTAASLELSSWATLAALAAPHLLYAFIWFYPHAWQHWFGKRACEWFERIAWALKGKTTVCVSACVQLCRKGARTDCSARMSTKVHVCAL